MTLTDSHVPTTSDTTPEVASPTAAAHTVGRHWTGAPSDSPWLERARAVAPAIAPAAEQHDRDGTFVAESMAAVRGAGLFEMLVPADVGGGGASHAATCAVLAELARGCPATSLTLSMHSHLVAAQVWRHHRDLPAPVLSKVADQRIYLISTGASDWLESSGTVTKVEGGYRVSDRKLPSSGCPFGDVLVTSFRWDDAPERPQVIHCAVPFTTEGVSIEETWDTMGMRGTGSHTVVLDDVFVPDAAIALTRPAGEWHPVWATVVGAAMPLIMSTYVGVAEEAAARAVELFHRRTQRPETVALVGAMLTRLTAAKDTVAAMIAASDDLTFDNTIEHADLILRRKTTAAEACIDTVRLALEVGGGMAYSRGSGIERLYRDVHGALYHPLPAAQQEVFTGELAR